MTEEYAIERLQHKIKCMEDGAVCCDFGNDKEVFKLAIKALEQEPVIHAKWERGYSFPDGAYWKCSHCNELIKVKIPMHYCSNCGAKMDKE